MGKSESYEIEAEVVVYKSAEIKLRKAVLLLGLAVFSIVFAYASIDYAFVVSDKKFDYAFALCTVMLACVSIRTAAIYIRRLYFSRRGE